MATSLAPFRKHQAAAKPPVFLLYGTSGIAKTTTAAQAPNPIFLCTEDGLGMNVVDAFEPYPTKWQDVLSYMAYLFENDTGHQTFVVDSLSALEPMIWKQVAHDNNKSSIEDLGYGKGYVMALDYWQQFLQGVIALRDQKNIMPILIAHADIVRYDSPEVEPFDRYQIKLHKRAFQLLYERCDIIGFANWRTLITKDDVGFNKKQARGIGTGERLLHLVEKPAYIAKNRYGLPETIPLSWQSFSEALSAAFPQQPAPEMAQTSTKKGA
jgi:hypothetical protein